MVSIQFILNGVDVVDARSALYYASRYIKQAHLSAEYNKDVFLDLVEDSPNSRVITLAKKIIETLEASEGKPATEFEDKTVERILALIMTVEGELEPELTEEEIKKAALLLASFQSPSMD